MLCSFMLATVSENLAATSSYSLHEFVVPRYSENKLVAATGYYLSTCFGFSETPETLTN